MGELYIFSVGTFGLTPCAPVVKFGEEDQYTSSTFEAALCMDINPSGPLRDYFMFRYLEDGDQGNDQYMLFNDASNSAAAFDLVGDSTSQFREFFNQIIKRTLA